MSARIATGVAQTILRVTVRTAEQAEQAEQAPPGETGHRTQTGPGGGTITRGSGNGRPASGPNAKLGRNDPCWCGSGKKFKKCHGR
ncbi:MAG TPA: SEC-C metal-binding domain-containing protein, partial [Candidatus Limnocylindria bacterium]|nr:SEC-C metal-binding domain-containing protein [Candidatus Limnocylindria bacterium]